MLPEQQQRILGYFIEEARDHLNTIEQGLLNLEGTLNDPEMISEVFRAAHSIKGGAAMLGLTSIQHTSHRLEDCFKVLKDNPVQIDQKLESLFLGVSDTLKSLLEHLSGPYGLSEDAANTLMSETEPVFQWLYEHLELLVQQGKSGVSSNPDATELHTTSVENVSTLTELFLRRDIPSLAEDTHQESPEISVSVAPQQVRDANAALSPVTAKEHNNWGEFQAQVLQTLREMLQLFKQTTTPSTRQNLQQCCYQLVKLGETWNVSKWCGLCQAAASAIGNPENSYLTLAKIVITEIKQAQELVLQGREAEIAISQQLEALLSLAEIDLLEVTPDLFDEQSAVLTESSTTSEAIFEGNTEQLDLAQTTEELNLDKDTSDSAALVSPRASGYANVKGDRPYVQQGTPLNAATHTSFSFTTHDEAHPISNNLDPNGPEVGIAELNTLADLFAGETPELDESWHQEETLDIVASDDFGIDFSNTDAEDAHSDLSDLLSLDQVATTATTEDLSLLFGDNFLEKENSEPQHQQTSATIPELSSINVLDINLDSSSEDLQEFIDIPSETNQLAGVNKNDVVEDLLTLGLDDDIELLPTDEVAQPETEAFANVELSTNQANSFDNLFSETRNANWVEAITPSDYIELPQETGFSSDNLFAEMEEETLLPTSESEIVDLFDISTVTTSEFSQSENDLSSFWNQEITEEQDDFNSLIEQNVERALEESLFATTDDIFADSQQPIPSDRASFGLEELDINFQHEEQLDLIFSSDSGDDLFDELAQSDSAISSVISNTSTPEMPFFTQHLGEETLRAQQPEALDFAPEFTHQPSEISAVDLELDSFGSFDENPQLLFEDAVTDSTYIQMETTENTVDELSLTGTLDSVQAQPDDLFGSFDENSQLLFEDAVTDSTYIQMETTENTVDELSLTGTLDSVQAQPDDLFGSFDENPQLLFEDVATSTYIQMEPTENTVDELSLTETLDSVQEQPDDLFGSFDENSQLLFEDVATDSTYIQMEPTENTVDVSLTETSLDISFGDTSNSAQTNLENFETEENNNLETAFELPINPDLDDTHLGFANALLFTETALLEATNQQQLEENAATIDSQDVNDFTQTIIQEDVETDLYDLGEISESVTVSEDENAILASDEELVTTETVELVAPEDDFADLEALLGEEVALNSKATSIPEVDFAALEELLGTDNDSNVHDGLRQRQPFNTQPVLAKNDVPPPAIDEFGDLEKLLAEADQTISHSPAAKSNTSKPPRPSTRRAARFEETMKVPVKQLDDMSNLVGELVVNRNTLEQDHERLRQSLDNLLIQVQQLSDVGARMQELYERSLLEASLLAGRKKKDSGLQAPDFNADRGFSELEMDRFTPFHTLSQQMIERIVRVRESASDIDFVTEETERVARQFRQVTTQLQEGLTRARMVPFAQTIDRWRRGVRDNAIKCGKQVELVIEGGDTLIDKMILDHLTDPLTHMLNNAIAHGIETPEERQAAGKPPVGIITIRAFYQGNQTIISVGDDGAGIDSAKVKAKAVKIGMITEAQAKAMSRLEVYDLLFQSGFTIKDQADEISGRGVGMDVVRSEISEIRGTVNTDSAIGKGTTFTIRLPLTLSICKALCCVSDRSRIAFPMDGVEDTLDIPVKNIQHDANGQSFISWRDTVLPFRPLKELLTFNRQISRGNVYGGTRDDDMVSVVVVRSANTLIALQIDLVLSEQEIVIKQFEGPAPKPIGVAGATVLGDGRIMPIADVLEIIDIFQGRISTQMGGNSWQQKGAPIDTSPAKIDPTVLIVDDSITVRELLSLTFNKAGYRVEQARDGQEAWDKLRSGLPCDIVFCDIEMPRCDGLELLSRIQKDSNLNHLPIAMLTSRGADKHRQIAAQLGASGYFTKPYLEEALLEAAARMLKGEKLVSTTSNV
ncbi:response regulator [Nostoc sp. ATCC 53789]|uniref:hybrid sensor histidine kinase/response regulator n=1 Tax=Nostoc sp. ATCC 53789 TaxID=76335 RepID=UPI000DEC2939|nr:response regulator [Nostoc sp. ATCC 53789]QHG16344.1 response regulator [Nostoc sp. ATCC 53789]RCJ22823.1 hybrid sensor histidine kinase/response regulator [Nostoc sp. ATCC 53789]